VRHPHLTEKALFPKSSAGAVNLQRCGQAVHAISTFHPRTSRSPQVPALVMAARQHQPAQAKPPCPDQAEAGFDWQHRPSKVLDPLSHPTNGRTASIDVPAAWRNSWERNKEIAGWLESIPQSSSAGGALSINEWGSPTLPTSDVLAVVGNRGPPITNATDKHPSQDRRVPIEGAAKPNLPDLSPMRETRQPVTSETATEGLKHLRHGTDSVGSCAATWSTRSQSLPGSTSNHGAVITDITMKKPPPSSIIQLRSEMLGGSSTSGLAKRCRPDGELKRRFSKVDSADIGRRPTSSWRKPFGAAERPRPTWGSSTRLCKAMESNEGNDFDMAPPMEPCDVVPLSKTFNGFQQHILTLSPMLRTRNVYLVDRIAFQQVMRYGSLLNAKINHLDQRGNCASGPRCNALGGSPRPLDRVPFRASAPNSDDEDSGPGAITEHSFPPGIPTPPVKRLPATLECQACYQIQAIAKPSDWTRHIIQDLQPYTCTFETCSDPKMFKHRADWIKHENEEHRHLEWWSCDIKDCRHVCYRQDTFLQHLVRDHKYPEVEVQPKIPMDRSRCSDPTWQKLFICHHETRQRPQEEPCRFCGRTFRTWKKLSVHVSIHMAQIVLPILKLTAEENVVAADTAVSPVQGPRPRHFSERKDHGTRLVESQGFRSSGLLYNAYATPPVQDNSSPQSTSSFPYNPPAENHFGPSTIHLRPQPHNRAAALTPLSLWNPSSASRHHSERSISFSPIMELCNTCSFSSAVSTKVEDNRSVMITLEEGTNDAQHDHSTAHAHHSAAIYASKFGLPMLTTLVNSTWHPERNTSYNSAKKLLKDHPPGPTQRACCLRCGEALHECVGHPVTPHSEGGVCPNVGVRGMNGCGHGDGILVDPESASIPSTDLGTPDLANDHGVTGIQAFPMANLVSEVVEKPSNEVLVHHVLPNPIGGSAANSFCPPQTPSDTQALHANNPTKNVSDLLREEEKYLGTKKAVTSVPEKSFIARDSPSDRELQKTLSNLGLAVEGDPAQLDKQSALPADDDAMEIDPMEQLVSRPQEGRTPPSRKTGSIVGDGTKRAITEQQMSQVSQLQIEGVKTPARDVRQIGVAKIRLKFLSISRIPNVDGDCANSDASSIDEDDRPVDEDGEQTGPSNNSNSNSYDSGPGGSAGVGQGAQGDSGPSGNETQDSGSRERGGDGQGGSRKRRRPNTPNSSNKRFACPYQVYEQFHHCLQRGPRNPEGGCKGMYRLRCVLCRLRRLKPPLCRRCQHTP